MPNFSLFNTLNAPFMRRLARAAAAAAAITGGGIVMQGCAADSTADVATDVGTLQMNLTSTAVSGDMATYRLAATFLLNGDGIVDEVLASELESTETVISRPALALGDYTVELQGDYWDETGRIGTNWVIEKRIDEGADAMDPGDDNWQRMPAGTVNQLTPSMQNAVIQSGATTTVTYRFEVEGNILEFGSGDLEVAARLEETDRAHYSQSSAGVYVYGVTDDGELHAWEGDKVSLEHPAVAFLNREAMKFGEVEAVTHNSKELCVLVDGKVKCVTTVEDEVSTGRESVRTLINRDATAIAAGTDFTCALVNGGVKCWDDGEKAGDVTAVQDSTSADLTGAVALSLTDTYGCATFDDGHAACWQNNQQAVDLTYRPATDGMTEFGDTAFGYNEEALFAIDVAAGIGNFVCVLTEDSEVFCGSTSAQLSQKGWVVEAFDVVASDTEVCVMMDKDGDQKVDVVCDNRLVFRGAGSDIEDVTDNDLLEVVHMDLAATDRLCVTKQDQSIECTDDLAAEAESTYNQ